jgi:HSP20 family protein
MNPASEARAFEEIFDKLFGSPSRITHTATATLPIDIYEREGNLVVRAAVPGIEPTDLEINIENNVLTIRGETKHDSETSEDKIYRREVSYGSFSRSVRLPENLNVEAVEAEFKNGIVTITLPRIPEEKPKSFRVPVKTIEAHESRGLIGKRQMLRS